MKNIVFKRDSQTLRAIFVEVFSIVLGIILALAVNDWAESRQMRLRLNDALVNVKEEINTNLRTLEHIHANNSRTVTMMFSEDGETDTTEGSIVPGIILQNTAWELLRASGVNPFLNYSLLMKLSELYELQDTYVYMGEQLINSTNSGLVLSLIGDRRIEQDQILRKLESLLQMMIKIEDGLLAEYHETDSLLTDYGHAASEK